MGVIRQRLLAVLLSKGAELAVQDFNKKIAIAAGADFLKMSTGKIAHGASLEASAILLEQIAQAKQPVGLKISGGVRDIATAQAYIAQAAAKMGADWVQPENFRIGASSLLKELISC